MVLCCVVLLCCVEASKRCAVLFCVEVRRAREDAATLWCVEINVAGGGRKTS